MKPAAKNGERGQAIVFLALALVGVLGFAALALDGGNLYTEQRRAQAAADNAVLAAAFNQMKSGKTVTTSVLSGVALGHAALNGYTNDGTTNTVTFHRPPIHGPYTGNSRYMEVVITQKVTTALAHIVYRQSPIPLTVFAVAHGRPAVPGMEGFAIAAMKPGCGGSSTISLSGDGGGSSGGTYLYGGGAFANSNCSDALDLNGGNALYAQTGYPISIVGGMAGTSTCTSPGVPSNCNVYPAPTTGVAEQEQDPLADFADVVAPKCSTYTARTLASQVTSNSGTHTIQPGTYTSLNPGSSFGGTIVYAPGIYCLTGETTGDYLSTGNGTVEGEGVLIFLVNGGTRIDVSGNGSRGITLSAPTVATTGCTGQEDTSKEICAYLNLVIMKLANSPGACDSSSVIDIEITGGAYKELVGLVYAPYSMVRYGGGGTFVQTGQTISGCVNFNGNGNIQIYYDPESTFSPAPAIRLDE